MLLLLYDVRPDSPTCGKLSTIVLSKQDRKLIRQGACLTARPVLMSDTMNEPFRGAGKCGV